VTIHSSLYVRLLTFFLYSFESRRRSSWGFCRARCIQTSRSTVGIGGAHVGRRQEDRDRNNQATAAVHFARRLLTPNLTFVSGSRVMDIPSELLTCICGKVCTSQSGLTRHQNASGHAQNTSGDGSERDAFGGSTFTYHEVFTGALLRIIVFPCFSNHLGRPCTEDGDFLPWDAPPPSQPWATDDARLPFAWTPFHSRADFDFAWNHFVKSQNSGPEITEALEVRAADLLGTNTTPTWSKAGDMYNTIDAIEGGDLPFGVFRFRYKGKPPVGQNQKVPRWSKRTYELHAANLRQVIHGQLASPELRGHVDVAPYRQFAPDGQRVVSNLMSGEWAWKKAVSLFSSLPTLDGDL
jgi:hypothetical protein